MSDEATPWDIRYNHEEAIKKFISCYLNFVEGFVDLKPEDTECAEQAMRNIQSQAWEEGFEAGNGLEFNINTPNPYLETK